MGWIGFLIIVAVILGLSKRILQGSTRMTLIVVVAVALLGLYVTTLR